jgi:beta-galactosidase
MNRNGGLVWLAAAALACCAAALRAQTAVQLGGERRLSFNDGWRFTRGDPAGAEMPGFDDSGWRTLRLPHDWAIEGPFDRRYSTSMGALPYHGAGWYRKSFTLPDAARGRHLRLEFDGAMANARVWLNGHELGERPYGYISFYFDITPHVRFGGAANVLAVRLAPEDRSSRWYPGAGIYRNVWLTVTGMQHVAQWGTFVTTPQVAGSSATVSVKTQVANAAGAPAKVRLRTTVMDASGRQVEQSVADVDVPARGWQTVETTLRLRRAERWDLQKPYLYSLVSEVLQGGQAADRYVTPFGIRTIQFTADKGFLLNGRPVKLRGVCLHHDLGALGAAVNRRAIERQLQIMQAMGVNAIRTSHNPPAPELLDLCDRMGLLVMDEAFDVWRAAKVPNDYSKHFDQWGETDLRDLLRRDRNHPSVIMWSIGNEVQEQSRPEGGAIARRLANICRQEDPTRPVTSAMNNPDRAMTNGMAEALDIKGFNYKPHFYEPVMKQHPGWILLGAETASTVSSRGVYHLPLEDYERHESLQVTSYDVVAPAWATPPDAEFAVQDRFPNVLGEFVWTGFDYLGEPTPYAGTRADPARDWPSRSSYFGIVDLAGFPKDRYYLYQSQWTTKPMVHLLPHWNWQGMEGKPIPVMVYTNCDEADLTLNGKSLGRKKRYAEPVIIPVGKNVSPDRKFASRYRLMWEVPYAPGVLEVTGYKGRKKAAVATVRTAGAPAKVTLVPDRTAIRAGGDDLAFITVRIEDEAGNLCPLAGNLVRFQVSGPGSIAAVDNGNAATIEPFQSDSRNAFNGLALLIVRSQPGQAGKIQVSAVSDGLQAGAAVLTAR